MTFFKKKETSQEDSYEKKESTLYPTPSIESLPKIKKRLRIGFGHKEKTEQENVVSVNEKRPSVSEDQRVIARNRPFSSEQQGETLKDHEDIDVFLDDIPTPEEKVRKGILESEVKEEKDWSSSKRKAFAQKDMTGKIVYLEDTGEKLGIVFDAVYDEEKNLIGYKIKDSKSDTILSFPLDQFDEDKNGLIFIPSWYTKGMKTIEKLEFKDRITPELMWLIKDHTVSTEELYSIFVKHDDKIVNYMEEAVTLRNLVTNRLRILEKERLSLKENLMDLTEKRLIKDIDRRQFSEIVMDHRRKVNVVDINIKKCKELLERLQHTSFGVLSQNIASTFEQEEQRLPENIENNRKKENLHSNQAIEHSYREKYFDLKERYNKLQDGYNELKIAVEKLLNKNEL